MTQTLSPESPRRAAAREFGNALRAAIARSGISKRRLAVDAHVTRSAIANYCAGLNLPTFATAERLADVLSNDGLRAIIARSREYVCPVDRVRFTFSGQSRRTYCSPECQRVAEKMRGGGPRRTSADLAERRLRIHQSAVGAMCRSCQPDGECRDAGCALRPVSPLPLADDVFKRIGGAA